MGNHTHTELLWTQIRLAWIERQAARAGTIRRREICAALQLSMAQASADLQALQELHPGCLSYDLNRKCYCWTGQPLRMPVPALIHDLTD